VARPVREAGKRKRQGPGRFGVSHRGISVSTGLIRQKRHRFRTRAMVRASLAAAGFLR
jgi:hypothetical protein